jgi:hypothetical protein
MQILTGRCLCEQIAEAQSMDLVRYTKLVLVRDR